jgi:hypothetical protein
MLAPPAGSQPLQSWAWGPLSVTWRSGTPTYRLEVKTRRMTCRHTLPCILWLRTSPLCQEELRRCHVSCDSEPYPPIKESSGATTCHAAPDLSSLPRRASVLPRDMWLRTSPSCQGGLRRYHMSRGSRPGLPTGKGSGAGTCPTALSGPRAPSDKGVVVGSTKHLRLARSQGAHTYNAAIASKGRMRRADRRLQCSADCYRLLTIIDHVFPRRCDLTGRHHGADHA